MSRQKLAQKLLERFLENHVHSTILFPDCEVKTLGDAVTSFLAHHSGVTLNRFGVYDSQREKVVDVRDQEWNRQFRPLACGTELFLVHHIYGPEKERVPDRLFRHSSHEGVYSDYDKELRRYGFQFADPVTTLAVIRQIGAPLKKAPRWWYCVGAFWQGGDGLSRKIEFQKNDHTGVHEDLSIQKTKDEWHHLLPPTLCVMYLGE